MQLNVSQFELVAGEEHHRYNSKGHRTMTAILLLCCEPEIAMLSLRPEGWVRPAFGRPSDGNQTSVTQPIMLSA